MITQITKRLHRFSLCGFIILAAMSYCGYAEAEGIKPISDYVPEPWNEKLRIDVETRYRFEYRDNFDFNDAKDDEDGFHLLRTRINIDFEPLDYIRTYIELQDSRIWGSKFKDKSPYKDSIDLRQAYIDIKRLLGDALTLRVGRQELIYGDERVLGAFNWSNVARSFDAIKLILNYKDLNIDGFFARRVIIDTNEFNEWDDDDDLYGLYTTYKGIEKHTLDLYYLLRDTDKNIAFGPNVGSGKLTESTVGYRIVGKELWGFDYELEPIFQFGDFGSEDIEAFALVAILGYTFDIPWSPRIGFEWDHGSGDKDRNDGERNTFDNLFPTNHSKYGYMDRASLQNLNDFRIILSVTPLKKLYLEGNIHFINVDDTSDSLYDSGGKALRTAANSGGSNFVGTELDFLLTYALHKNLKILAGYSHFFAGKYLDETGSGDNGKFVYAQATLSF